MKISAKVPCFNCSMTLKRNKTICIILFCIHNNNSKNKHFQHIMHFD